MRARRPHPVEVAIMAFRPGEDCGDRLAAINVANAAALIATILPARKNNKPLTILGVAASMALTLVSWNLYADYYDQHHTNNH
jgi:hypothetical protein